MLYINGDFIQRQSILTSVTNWQLIPATFSTDNYLKAETQTKVQHGIWVIFPKTRFRLGPGISTITFFFFPFFFITLTNIAQTFGGCLQGNWKRIGKLFRDLSFRKRDAVLSFHPMCRFFAPYEVVSSRLPGFSQQRGKPKEITPVGRSMGRVGSHQM